jgi:hypothetical protein
LRGGLASIECETKFLPASDWANGDKKVIREDYAGHNKHNTGRERQQLLANTIKFNEAHFYRSLPCFTFSSSVIQKAFPPAASAEDQQSNIAITNECGWAV